MDIGRRLAEIRKEHNLKQSDLAITLNESQQVISNIERGLTLPNIDQLRKLADYYNISLDKLVGREFFGDNANDVERQVINYLNQMDDSGKELSLSLLSQVAQHQGNSDGKE